MNFWLFRKAPEASLTKAVIYAILMRSESWQQHLAQRDSCSFKINQNGQLQVNIRNAVIKCEWGSCLVQFQIWNRKKSPEDMSTLNEVYLLFSIMQNFEKYVWQVTSKILFNSITFFLSLISVTSINVLQVLKRGPLFSKCSLYQMKRLYG